MKFWAVLGSRDCREKNLPTATFWGGFFQLFVCKKKFEIFVKSMPPSLSELKVIPSFCFAFKIPDDVTATNTYGSLAFFSLQPQLPKTAQN